MALVVPTDIRPYVESVRGRKRMDESLVMLAASSTDARELGLDPWQFAVEFESLTARGLTTADLRWLALKGLVQHAVETTDAGQYERVFDHEVGPTTIGPRTCVTLTPLGVRVADQLVARINLRASDKPIRWPKPAWRSEVAELSVGGVLVKRYRVPAPNQQTILSAFEEEGWPARIDDPLPLKPEREPRRTLHDTINSLNARQVNTLVRFVGDGSGEGVQWELIEGAALRRACA
ncbi:MAG: hypothetical protein MI757_05185 [Pirellulales bacterium]|nr:hypothetical protein [Pirellulales bacterium]